MIMGEKDQASIVLIEDNLMHGRMYEMQFARAGFARAYVYQIAEDGIRAIKEMKPDLVLLDIGLQDIDGISILEMIKYDTKTAHIPVIMLSNMRKQDKGKEAKALGAADYYVKAEHLPHEVVEKVRVFLLK